MVEYDILSALVKIIYAKRDVIYALGLFIRPEQDSTMSRNAQRLFISLLIAILLEQHKMLTANIVIYSMAAIIQELCTSQELYTDIRQCITSYLRPNASV